MLLYVTFNQKKKNQIQVCTELGVPPSTVSTWCSKEESEKIIKAYELNKINTTRKKNEIFKI